MPMVAASCKKLHFVSFRETISKSMIGTVDGVCHLPTTTDTDENVVSGEGNKGHLIAIPLINMEFQKKLIKSGKESCN